MCAQSLTYVKNRKDYEMINMDNIQLVCVIFGQKLKKKIHKSLGLKWVILYQYGRKDP